jgi:hypothetical protein
MQTRLAACPPRRLRLLEIENAMLSRETMSQVVGQVEQLLGDFQPNATSSLALEIQQAVHIARQL